MVCNADHPTIVSGRAGLTSNGRPVIEVVSAFGYLLVASDRIEGAFQVETVFEIRMVSLETAIEVGDDDPFACITKLPCLINLTTIDIPLKIPTVIAGREQQFVRWRLRR